MPNGGMQTLTAQWYNAVVTGLQLSSSQFQLFQGSAAAVKTSPEMWAIFNALPPDAIANFSDLVSDANNNLASAYGQILSSLIAGSDSDFRNCMGDYYGQWMVYIRSNIPSPLNANTISDVFNNWAMMNAPGQARCVSALTRSFINPVLYANMIFQAAEGVYAFDQTIDGLQNALGGGLAKSFTLDSNTASSDMANTWTSAVPSDGINLFTVDENADYANLTAKLIASRLNVTVDFKKVTTFSASPYSQANGDQSLSRYNPWYVPSALRLAYDSHDFMVWNNQRPINWDKAFGPNGLLQRMTSAIVVADGIEITIISASSMNTEDQTSIKVASANGLWPFFKPSGEDGTSNSVTFDDSGNLTATISIPLGNPQVIGVLQTPISAVFG